MKHIILAVLLVIVSDSAFAATAFWTGRMDQAQTVTNQAVWNCEYIYAGNRFWRAYRSYCPSSVEVY